MNKQRRAVLEDIIQRLNSASEIIADALDDLNGAKDEEQEYFDVMPESLQGGERGQAAEEAISWMEDASGNLEDVVSTLDDAMATIGYIS